MKILSRDIIIFLIVFFLLNNFLEVSTQSFFPIFSLVFFLSYLILPGTLLIMIFRMKGLIFWEWLFYSIGLSIFFLEIGGVLINSLGFVSLLHVNNPLSFTNLLIGFNILIIPMFILAWIRQKNSRIHLNIPNPSLGNKIFYTIPLLFPLFSIFGTISLNNNGSNLITLFLLLGIAIYIIILARFKKDAGDNLFAYSLFLIGLSMLFSTSLRGFSIAGHDISREYYVFNLTNTNHIWDLSSYKDAYNACLSITILPTVLTNLLKIGDIYIYKVIYQILFTMCPVIVYYIARKFSSNIFAFLSAIYFISFPTFFNDMPMLNRQEIGFIFFGLLLYVLLISKNLSEKFKTILFIIFAFGVIISHYSTNYVLLGLLSISYIFRLTYQFVHSNKLFNVIRTPAKDKFTDSSIISLRVIVIIFALTFLWNNQLTKTSGNIGDVTEKVVKKTFITAENESRSTDTNYSLFFRPHQDPKQTFQSYIDKISSAIKSRKIGDFYSQQEIQNYPVHLVNQPLLPPTPLGDALLKYNIPVFTVQSTLRQAAAAYIQIAVFLGITIIVLRKSNIPFSLTYYAISFSGLALLITIIILPSLSVEYGLLRLFQQMLFLFSLPIVITTYWFFTMIKFKENYRTLATSLVTVTFILTVTGFTSHLTGLYFPQMTLDNAGNYYDIYYTTYANTLSATWLKTHQEHFAVVQSDMSGSLKLTVSTGNINSLVGLFPQTLLKNSYVYLPNIVNVDRFGIVSISQDTFRYNSPTAFLNNHKNLIYSNGEDVVYR